jgi:hypothetical protein
LQGTELAANSQRVSERLYDLLPVGEGGRRQRTQAVEHCPQPIRVSVQLVLPCRRRRQAAGLLQLPQIASKLVDHRVQLPKLQTRLPDFFTQIAACGLALLDNYIRNRIENELALGLQTLA